MGLADQTAEAPGSGDHPPWYGERSFVGVWVVRGGRSCRGARRPKARGVVRRFLIAAVGLALLVAATVAVARLRSADTQHEAALLRTTSPEAATDLAPPHTPPPTTPPSGSSSTSTVPDDGCDLRLGSGDTLLDGTGADLPPGAVICLEAGTRPPLRIHGVHGTDRQPITIVNRGRVVIEGEDEDYAGVDVTGSSNLRITGSGDVDHRCGSQHEPGDQRCGILIRGTGRGVAGTEITDRITVDHVEITATTHSGIFIRTEIEEGAGRDTFVQRSTTVTDSYLHQVGKEGVYLGSSSYHEGSDPVLEGVVVARNLVIEPGWDGIQVGSAVSDCTIAGNTVVLAGTQNRSNQNSGIINNRGSVCDISENVVVGSAGHAVFVQGNGGNRVYNNVLVGAGSRNPSQGDAIVIATGSNVDQAIAVWHNTIVAPARSGVRYRNEVGAGNEIVNNLVVAWNSTSPAIDVGGLANVRVEANLEIDDLDDAGFLDAEAGDFRLRPTSPAVDSGLDLGPGAGADFWGLTRPLGAAADVGAFETPKPAP